MDLEFRDTSGEEAKSFSARRLTEIWRPLLVVAACCAFVLGAAALTLWLHARGWIVL